MIHLITVVDARMGRGKSSAAIRYMNEHKDDKRFLYITPFLSEVERVCKKCDFDQPDCALGSKSRTLKRYLKAGENVAATHSLFYLMDSEAKALLRDMHYTLIVDESISLIASEPVSPWDKDMLMKTFVTEDEDHKLIWTEPQYTGVLKETRKKIEAGTLYNTDFGFMKIASPDILKSCEDVFMLTYMLRGQYQYAYLRYFGFDYRVIGIKEDADGFYFSNKPDDPPPVDYSGLIHVLEDRRLNEVGDDRTALSVSWFNTHGESTPEIQALRNNLYTYFQYRCRGSRKSSRMWTCFKDYSERLLGDKGRYKDSFVQVGARATNDLSDRTHLAYLANRFVDPNIAKFFADKDIRIDPKDFALAEMLQWIWRSAIRLDREIWIYIPSSRMRWLLKDWIREVSRV